MVYMCISILHYMCHSKPLLDSGICIIIVLSKVGEHKVKVQSFIVIMDIFFNSYKLLT